MTTKPSHRTGAALIAVTAMIVVASLVVAGVYYFLQRGTVVSGLEKRYQTAREASLGGIDVFTKEVVAGVLQGSNLSVIVNNFNTSVNATVTRGATDTCFTTKITGATADWGACAISLSDPKTSPDVTFRLSAVASGQYYNVYAKIVDTVPGNSDRSGFSLEGQGVAEGGSGMIAVEHFPYMYRIDTQGERLAAPEEKAKFTILYAY